MDPTTVTRKLIAVLGQIQAESGLECPRLSGTAKPVETLPEFDSLVWPVATTLLATDIGMTIPNNLNIFVDETTKLPRSIYETAVAVCELLIHQSERETE